MEMFNPPHPGAMIKDTMEELNLSARALAKALEVSPSTIQRVITGKAEISPKMAIRLSAVIGSSPNFWLNLQDIYDLWYAKQHVDVSHLHRLNFA